MRPATMESGGGSNVASCFSTPDLTLIETSTRQDCAERAPALPDQERRIVGALVARGTRETAESTPARPQARDDSVALLSMFDDVRDKTSAAKEWDRLINNLPAEGPRSPESGPQPRTG